MTIKKFALNTSTLSGAKILASASQLLIIPIMARYLSPEDFGLMAIAMTFIVLSMVITDIGLGHSLIRSSSSDDLSWSSAFWFVLCSGLTLSVLLAALAPVISWGFSEPGIQPVLFALALVPLIQSSCTIPQAEMQKRGAIPQIAMGETIATFISFAVAIWVATQGGGIWALVAQQLIFWLVRSININCLTRFRPLWRFSWQSLRQHLNFSRDTAGFSLVEFILLQCHNLAIGALLGAHALGFYAMAARFSNLASELIARPLSYSLYSHLVTMQNNPVAIRHTLISITRLLAIIIFPAMALVAAAGQTFFTLLLSEKWAAVANIFLFMAPAGALSGAAFLYGTVLMAIGQTALRLRIAIEMAAYWIVLLLCVVSFGLEAIAIANTLWFFSYFPRLTGLFLNSIDCPRKTYLLLFIKPGLIAFAVALFHNYIILQCGLSQWLEISLLLIELFSAWGLCIFIDRQNIWDELRSLKKII